MNRILLGVVVLALVVALAGLSTSYAQQNAFNRNDKVISAGVGFGMYGLYGSSSLPPIFVAFEMGVAEKITVGGAVGYSGSSDTWEFGKWTYSYIPIEVRGAYHFLEKEKSFDAYAGAGLGYVIVSSSVTYTDPTIQHYGFSASGSYMFFDIFVGGRYYFSPKFAAMAEVGYGLGFFRIGVSYKL
jgi:hypothetical protein